MDQSTGNRVVEMSAAGKGINWDDPAQVAAYRRAYCREWRKTHRGKHGKGLKLERKKHNGRAMTLVEVAKHFGITSERVHQIEQAALRKLRTRFKELGLTYYNLVAAPAGESLWEEIMGRGEAE